MKTIRRMLASAMVIAVGLSTAYAAPTTNTWWGVDFADYTANELIAGVSQDDGVWSNRHSPDASSVTNAAIKGYPASSTTNMGKLDPDGGALVWTPTSAPAGTTKALIETKVYMVGSEDNPAASTGTVQTEVYLTNSIVATVTNSYLCAHVGDGAGGTQWVKLAGVTVTNETWIDLTIEINYDATPPQVAFFVGSTQMTKGESGPDWFDVMPSGASQGTVTDVTFVGTGYFDNFTGQAVAAPGATTSYTNTDKEGPIVAGSIAEDTEAKTVTATFDDPLTTYIQMTGPLGFVQTARATGGSATFSTDGLPAGTYSITAYYGTAPTVIPSGYTPAAEAAEGYKAAEVAADTITLNVVPVSGLYYTLFAGETVTGAKAAAASTLATPADENAGFLQLSMPVPAAGNEVKIIKIVASDDAYAAEDPIPTP